MNIENTKKVTQPQKFTKRPDGATDEDMRPRRIIIQMEGKRAKWPVTVGINGIVYAIQPNVEAEVPQCVLNALHDAKEIIGEQDPDTKEITYHEKLSYAFSVLS